jgi:hypothetical protein
MEPVRFAAIATAAFAAGGVVFGAALYAIFYAIGKRTRNGVMTAIALVGYTGMAICVGVLSVALDFRGAWLLLTACLLLGYLIAPPLLWRLTVAMHSE